jgi:hypothetical protein
LVLAAAAAALLLLGLVGWLIVSYLLKSQTVHLPEKETLLGLQIGDSRDDVIAKLGKPTQKDVGKQLAGGMIKAFSQMVPGVDAEGMEALMAFPADQVDTLFWSDGQVCVVLLQNKIANVAVHSPHKATCAGGVQIGDTEARLNHIYASVVPETKAGPNGKGKVYRYDTRGIAFEVDNERVVGIALYAPMH